ncbi:MAG: UDP-glucose/GDP-mannose dehydrogenase family protein [Gemmatimonadales bacterium]|nr:UDP-glucose/GDP-mannose dehydrogenase family protein [Gemmatimonadales bacterium]
MQVSIFGLGYVGCVSAACFAKEGHDILGVDVSDVKVGLVNGGRATIVEEGIAELVADVHAAGRLRATTDVAAAVRATTISLVCVGTPSRRNGSLDLSYVERVSRQIGEALRGVDRPHTVVIRSTVLPGTLHDIVVPALEAGLGGPIAGRIVACVNPEFLREGTSIRDFHEPPFTLVGVDDPAHAEPLRQLYAGVRAPLHVVAVRTAEMIKYTCNCFHALKVGFANEVGNVCQALGVDSHEVMRLVCEDRKLNISPAYLKPGFAFGGSCLPKDLRAVAYRARELDVETPILSATLEGNQLQVDRAYRMILDTGRKRIGVLGLSFKPGTDDLRESPMVALIEMLLGKGCELVIHDREVSQSRLMGANREYIEREIPHIWTLMRDRASDVAAFGDVVLLGHNTEEYRALAFGLRPDQVLFDFARIASPPPALPGYRGINW